MPRFAGPRFFSGRRVYISMPVCFFFFFFLVAALRQVTYPLDDRGVVLLRGANLDDSGADSNGSGKTTLAMSALWALAGAVDARYVQLHIFPLEASFCMFVHRVKTARTHRRGICYRQQTVRGSMVGSRLASAGSPSAV